MYEFARGPLVWIAFIILVAGSLYKLATLVWMVKKDRTLYPTWSAKYGARSVLHWLIPFGSRTMQQRPLFTIMSWAFHLGLLITPLFVMGHAVLWHESWGFRWWSLPAGVADVMTLVVVFCGMFLLLRRIVSPEVRNVTTWKDYVLLLIVLAPFITGYIAHQQWLPYKATLVLHIVFGALWLIAIPFTWLSHMLMFIFTRSYMGSEFGKVRHARDW